MSKAESETQGGAAMFNLRGKVAVVLGGTTGLGRALSVGLAAAGAGTITTGTRECRRQYSATEPST